MAAETTSIFHCETVDDDGDALEPQPDPRPEVWIERPDGGVGLVMVRDPKNSIGGGGNQECPYLFIYRQQGRWMIVLHADGSGPFGAIEFPDDPIATPPRIEIDRMARRVEIVRNPQ